MRIDPNEYAIDRDGTDRAEATRICAAVISVIGDRVDTVWIDAYSDYESDMPREIRAARESIYDLGRRQHLRDPGTGVELRMDRPEDRALLETYAPWSILVNMRDSRLAAVASFHDCALSVTFKASPDEVQQIRDQLGSDLPVITLLEVHERQREAKRERRAQRRRQLRARVGLRDRT